MMRGKAPLSEPRPRHDELAVEDMGKIEEVIIEPVMETSSPHVRFQEPSPRALVDSPSVGNMQVDPNGTAWRAAETPAHFHAHDGESHRSEPREDRAPLPPPAAQRGAESQSGRGGEGPASHHERGESAAGRAGARASATAPVATVAERKRARLEQEAREGKEREDSERIARARMHREAEERRLADKERRDRIVAQFSRDARAGAAAAAHHDRTIMARALRRLRAAAERARMKEITASAHRAVRLKRAYLARWVRSTAQERALSEDRFRAASKLRRGALLRLGLSVMRDLRETSREEMERAEGIADQFLARRALRAWSALAAATAEARRQARIAAAEALRARIILREKREWFREWRTAYLRELDRIREEDEIEAMMEKAKHWLSADKAE